MTPIEIFEYKKSWQRQGGHNVRLHSDLRSKAKTFCKENLKTEQWDLSQYTNNYEDTFHFEHKSDAQQFATQWPKFVLGE
jgi:hypothetical protein